MSADVRFTKSECVSRYNRSGPRGAGNTGPGLTHSLDQSKEGLMPNYTRKATVCSVEGCERGGYITRGLCKTHYARLRRTGNPGCAELQHVVSVSGKVCSVASCDSPVDCKGLCRAHYKRLRKYGDPEGRPTRDRDARFDSYCVTTAEGCIQWISTIQSMGYGQFGIGKGHSVLAHRYAYERAYGPIPEGLVIDHLCRNRRCVNPEHLEAVTNLENMRRGAGYALINGMRNSCIHGHEYTPENTYTNPSDPTARRCRTCARERDRKRKAA